SIGAFSSRPAWRCPVQQEPWVLQPVNRREWGGASNRIRLLSPPVGNDAVTTYQVTLITDGQERTIPVGGNVYLLDAGIEAGLDMPFSCLQGWCTTCAGKMLEGKVDQSEARRVFPEDAEGGFVLLCSAYAR